MNSLFIAFSLLFISISAWSQTTVQLTVNSGNASTTCTDVIGAPDPQWQVNVANQGWVTYPQAGGCFTALPNVQYTQNYSCPSNVPANIQVCFSAFENDGIGICAITTSCFEQVCNSFPIPAPGNSSNITLNLTGAGLNSTGSVSFTISTTSNSPLPNDPLCGAEDIGMINFGSAFGDATQSTYNNFCATGVGEPSPFDQGATWYNNNGLWWQFTTGSNPLPYLEVITTTDPEGLGDDVNLQLALYESSDGTCNGTLTLVDNSYVTGSYDETMISNCLDPNTTYFLLVDGVADTPPELFGYFGLEVNVPMVENGPDLICNAANFGQVPDNGSVGTAMQQTNFCATALGDPSSGFTNDRTVWYQFTTPTSGNVNILATSDVGLDPVNIQLAVFSSSNNTCSGALTLEASANPANTNNVDIDLNCLPPNTPMWILVDGGIGNLTGIFSLTVTDLGGGPIQTIIDTLVCSGGSVTVGSNTYTASGTYTDVFALPSGCDSTVITNLTVLTPVVLNITPVTEAPAGGLPGASMQASATGGEGNFTYAWSDGQNTDLAINLTGGTNYCVTATDGAGCQATLCADAPYVLNITVQISDDNLLCNGDINGELIFSATGGFPPYTFSWQNAGNTLNGTGTLASVGTDQTIPNLPAGDYSVTVTDGSSVQIVDASIFEPLPLQIDLVNSQPVSCFGLCDGALQVFVSGGTLPYSVSWSNGATGDDLTGLCAGAITASVTDANGCQLTQSFDITEPPLFSATIDILQNVNCFGGNNGSATVTTNGTPASYQWSNGDNGSTATNLPAGPISVTVTNTDGCVAMASATISQPPIPVTVTISVVDEVSCAGGDDGVLQADANGPGGGFSYVWSTGQNGPILEDVPAGSYSVTVTDNAGCQATASQSLSEPPPIFISFETIDRTCDRTDLSGSIAVTSVGGGIGSYLYSLKPTGFSSDTLFQELEGGQYILYVQDAGGCVAEFPFFINTPPPLVVELGDDQQIELGETVTLTTNTLGSDLTYTWNVPSSASFNCLNDPVCDGISLLPIQEVLVGLTVFDTVTLCRAVDSVRITVIKDYQVFVPNVFSPDFDGINDYFTVYSDERVANIRQFLVFDRQGNLVFQREDMQPNDDLQGWDGTIDGKKAPVGVYGYLVEIKYIDRTTQIVKGDITLIR